MEWNYALLSHKAKLAGGPEALVEQVESAARSRGRFEGVSIGTAFTLGILGLGKLAYRSYMAKKAGVALAREELYARLSAIDAIAIDDSAETEDDVEDESER